MLLTCRSIPSSQSIECHAKILGGSRGFDGVLLFTHRHGLCVDLRQLLSGSAT